MDRIDGALGLLEVAALVQQLQDVLEKGDLALDLTGLTQIDTAGLQFLLSAQAEATVQGHALTLQMPQDGPVPELIARLGMEHAFDRAGPAEGHEQETTR